MVTHKCHKPVSLFLAAAFAIAPLLIAESAEAAASALFRMHRLWWGGTTTAGTPAPYSSKSFHPRSHGPNKGTDPTVAVGETTVQGKTVPRFTFPGKGAFIRDYSFFSKCDGANCSPGYPDFSVHYSYYNQPGSFRPNNSKFGGASMTTTVIFPTTGGNPLPPYNDGNPVTSTTTPCVGGGLVGCGYLVHNLPPGGTTENGGGGRPAGEKILFADGAYDFKRAGSIMITPGKNRFGGTMQFFYGPNHLYYRRNTNTTMYSFHSYGPQFNNRDPNAETAVGDIHYGGPWNAYRMTSLGVYRDTTANGEWIVKKAPYFYTIFPFTTGMVTAVVPFGGEITAFTLTGYDNRTPLGINGRISLVRPRMVHAYGVPSDLAEEITLKDATASAWQMTFHFRPVPEPGATVMLTSGFLALAGLIRLRRR